MGISRADKADEYMHHAEHCMKTARTISDREPRILHRQMAAEWIKLAQAMAEDGSLDASDRGSDKARRIATNVAKPYWHCRSLSSGGSVTELSATDAYRFAVGDVLCYEIVNQCGWSKLTTFEN